MVFFKGGMMVGYLPNAPQQSFKPRGNDLTSYAPPRLHYTRKTPSTSSGNKV